MIDPLASSKAGENFWLFLLTFRRNEQRGYWLPNGFCRRVPEQTFGAPIPTSDNPRQIFTDNRVVG
jgi:hypothetical protein